VGIDVVCINWAVFCLYNVPAVYDVSAALEMLRITRAAETWVKWSVGSVAYLAKRNPEPP
jgi:hypothetical protein